MTEMFSKDFRIYLQPTKFIDSDSPLIIEFARESAKDAATQIEKAVKIFYAVRDQIRYDPYNIHMSPEQFRASVVLTKKSGFCIEKALLLSATARALGIPSRLGFADVRNHLTTKQLRALMQTDLFVFHGYSELFINNNWVKATPTFNRSLCKRFGVHPIGFDGINDSIFHEFDAEGKKHMEYVNDRGHFVDLPYEEIVATLRKLYPIFFKKELSASADTFEEEAAKGE